LKGSLWKKKTALLKGGHGGALKVRSVYRREPKKGTVPIVKSEGRKISTTEEEKDRQKKKNECCLESGGLRRGGGKKRSTHSKLPREKHTEWERVLIGRTRHVRCKCTVKRANAGQKQAYKAWHLTCD